MNIEKYELIKKNKYNVYLSNGEVITLDERVITKNELLLKKELNIELYNKVIKESKVFELMDIAIKYISIRLRSIKEIKEYLKRKETEEEIINQTVEKLLKLGYLDDEKFAKAFVKDKMNFTSMGDYKIKTELEHLGISKDIIENEMAEIDQNKLAEKINKSINKQIKTNKKYEGQVLKNKIYTHLVSQGFSKEKIIIILNNYNF